MFTTLLALLLGTAVTIACIPSAFHLTGRILGSNIRSRAQQRRELLLSRAKKEEEEQQRQQGQQQSQNPSTSNLTSSSNTSLDDSWETLPTTQPQTNPTTSPTKTSDFSGIIAFFHPFCNAGGGGERVLFAALSATQLTHPRALLCIYTGDHDASKTQILTNAKNRFNIHLNPARICILYLSTREMVLASRWPYFTLLGQSLGSLVLGWEALGLLVPDLFVDTMGYAFVLGLVKWLFPAMPTGAYVHYPTISTDMLDSLNDEKNSGKGMNAGAGTGVRGRGKKLYWHLFAALYARLGASVDVVMTNSSWTQSHISALWSRPRSRRGKKHPISVVYPPCAVEELVAKIPVDRASEAARSRDLVYIAQFRPEKEHQTVIAAFHLFLKRSTHLWTGANAGKPKPKLVLIGSVRDSDDEKRVYKLRLQARGDSPAAAAVDGSGVGEEGEAIRFVVNAKWPVILDWLGRASVGVNAMWNEHFGIGVVEYQAAGLIGVVNGSGGPKADIVVEVDGAPTGFHATTTEEYAEGFEKALSLSDEEAFAMRLRARKSSWRFSEGVFKEAWLKHLGDLVAMVPNAGGDEKR